MTKLKPETYVKRRNKWIKALKDPKYMQIQWNFIDKSTSNRFCAIGLGAECQRQSVNSVTCDEFGLIIGGKRISYTTAVAQYYGLTDKQVNNILNMNDVKRRSFEYIANYIKRYINKDNTK